VPVPQNAEAAIAIYFETHDVPREQVEAQAEQDGLSLGDYCQVLLVSEAVQTACGQFLGMALSVQHPEASPEELLKKSHAAVVSIWHHPTVKGLPIHEHVTLVLERTASEVQTITGEILYNFSEED